MAKKQSVEESSGDKEKLMKLFKWIGPFYEEQQDLIWTMIKKYINSNHPKPIAGCNCSLSYASAFNMLRDWVMANGDKIK
jgi:hypothetical protein